MVGRCWRSVAHAAVGSGGTANHGPRWCRRLWQTHGAAGSPLDVMTSRSAGRPLEFRDLRRSGELQRRRTDGGGCEEVSRGISAVLRPGTGVCVVPLARLIPTCTGHLLLAQAIKACLAHSGDDSQSTFSRQVGRNHVAARPCRCATTVSLGIRWDVPCRPRRRSSSC